MVSKSVSSEDGKMADCPKKAKIPTGTSDPFTKKRRGYREDLSMLHHGHCFWGGNVEKEILVDSVNASFLGLKGSDDILS